MKNKIIIAVLIIIILTEIIGIILLKVNFNNEEKLVFDIAYQKQNQFKNPSTVKVTEATIYDGKYIILQIGGNNSFGAFVQDTYYVKDNTLYNKSDNYDIAKDISEKCFEYEKDNSIKIVKLNDDGIKKINNKLEKRYK